MAIESHLPNELAKFLRSHSTSAVESAVWGDGTISLTISLLITTDQPPDALVTSARCVVLATDRILVMSNPGGRHILPGGRREPQESITTALARELSEETGIAIGPADRIAVLHFHHETPKPHDYPFPYPDFLNQIYMVRLDSVPPVTVSDDYELAGTFLPIDDIDPESLPPIQRTLLSLMQNRRKAADR